MTEMDLAALIAECRAYLLARGLDVEQNSDFATLPLIAEAMAKEQGSRQGARAFTAHMDPSSNDFFAAGCFYLIVRDRAGAPVGMVGFRCDDLGQETLEAYVRRRAAILHGPAPDPGARRLPDLAREMTGQLLYVGEVYMARRARQGGDRRYLRAIFLIGYALGVLHWPRLAWVYGIMRDADVARGLPWAYMFARTLMFATAWSRPSDKINEDWLLATSRTELDALLSRGARALDDRAVEQDPAVLTFLHRQ